jgi:hypothetical protein
MSVANSCNPPLPCVTSGLLARTRGNANVSGAVGHRSRPILEPSCSYNKNNAKQDTYTNITSLCIAACRDTTAYSVISITIIDRSYARACTAISNVAALIRICVHTINITCARGTKNGM